MVGELPPPPERRRDEPLKGQKSGQNHAYVMFRELKETPYLISKCITGELEAISALCFRHLLSFPGSSPFFPEALPTQRAPLCLPGRKQTTTKQTQLEPHILGGDVEDLMKYPVPINLSPGGGGDWEHWARH